MNDIIETKKKLWSVIKHFPQVTSCGINYDTIKVGLTEPLPSFITEFEGISIVTEVIGHIKFQGL